MSALERIIKILTAIDAEKESLKERIDKYIRVEEEVKIKKEQNDSKKKLLVVSEYIAEELSRPRDPVEKISPEEKTEIVLLLNKRLSQVNNTQEKTRGIAQLIASYFSENISSSKSTAFDSLVIRRLIEQIRVQVSANKESSLGYAYFLIFLSESRPKILSMYKERMFSTVMPFDCLLGMYRVYFTLIKTVGKLESAWEFIASLLNYTEEINDTLNPAVLLVFLDVLNEKMKEKYNRSWDKILEYIRNIYIPLIDDSKYKTEIHQITSIVNRY